MSERLSGLALDSGLVLAFGLVVIAAGDGAGPVGFLMFKGSFRDCGFPMAAGWTAIVLLPISVLVSHNGLYLLITLVGLILLVISWWLFIRETEALAFSLVSSVPFFALLLARLRKAAYQGV